VAAELRCALSGEALKDPVVAADGETYERARIQEWLFKTVPDYPHGHDSSPVTNERLLHKALVDNKAVRRIAAAFHKARIQANDRRVFVEKTKTPCGWGFHWTTTGCVGLSLGCFTRLIDMM